MAEIRIPATMLKQKDKTLYLFKMNTTLLKEICYVTPRSEDNPDELQRVLDESRAKAIGKWLQEENSLLPNAIIVDLRPQVQIQRTADENIVTITIPDSTELTDRKLAYVLDGQHRLAGFKYSEGIEFDLPVVAVKDLSADVRGKIFADINSKQKKVDDILLLDLMYGIHELQDEEGKTYEIIKGLNGDDDSPLKVKIKTPTTHKDTWVKNTSLNTLIRPHVETGGILFHKTIGQQKEIIKSYFRAVKQTFPEAWGNNEDYVLTKTQGFDLIMSVFREVCESCRLFEGGQLNQVSFYNELKKLVGKNLVFDLPSGDVVTIPLDWKKEHYSKYSNRQWKTLFAKKIKDLLNQGKF